MSGGGSRHVGAPRTLNVQQFANARGVDVQSLHTALKDKKAKDGNDAGVAIPRCLRRRTTSHNRRKSFFWHRKEKKRKRGETDEVQVSVNAESGVADVGGDEVAVKAKRAPCRRVRRRIELKGDEKGGGGCSRDGTQRLVTHVWHAKRFTMTKIWGHWLAEGLPGRGRGSRAVIRWKNEAAVLHDASFYSAIELEGSWKSITEALQLVLEPAPPRSVELMSPKDQSVCSGAEYGKAMLHHLGRSPRGVIAPVTYIWRRESIAVEERRIWLWVHAGAFEEALSCLQLLCQGQGIHEKDQLQCWSRKGQFGRLDLLGSKAMSVLQKVLHPVASSASEDGGLDVSSRFLENNDQFPAGAVFELEVWDPRFRPGSDMPLEPSVLLDTGCDKNAVETVDHVGQKLERPSPFNQLEVLDSSDIWGRPGPTRQESVVMPLSEKDLSIRRHKKRLSYIQLNDGSEDTLEETTANIGNSKCSIMVLKHEHCGISLLLPVGWVRAFWVPLVFAGGHVVGLRERRWIQTDAKLPSFPHDYPDCYSYDQYMAEKSAEYQETYNRKPPSKRGLWKSEVLGWEFVHESSRLTTENCILSPAVSRADFEADISCGAVAAELSKRANGSSTGSDAHAVQLSICSSAQDVQIAVSGEGVSVLTITGNSVMDLSKPSNDTLISSSRNLTAQTIASNLGGDCTIAHVAVVQKRQRCRNIVELHGGPSSQPDLGSTSQVLVISDEGLEKKCDISAADLEDVAAIKKHVVSNDGDSGESSMFVARTQRTLQKVRSDCSLHDLPLLWKSSEKLLSNGHPSSLLADDAHTELLKKGCLARVRIRAPRKGAFEEGAFIYLPLLSDVDSYIFPSSRWKGFEDQSFKQGQQCRNTSCRTNMPEQRSVCRSLRVPTGIITSASVRGSSSAEAIGICEVAALDVLRARQLTDKRWPSVTSEIFLLVRNKFSPMYRPALASIVAETSDDLG